MRSGDGALGRATTDRREPVTTRSDQVLGDAHRRVELDELFRDVPPIKSIEELATPEVFETDEELEEFLAFVRADRNANLA